MIKLIAIDMDATLLRDDKTYDIARFKRVLQQLIAKGMFVCIATGNNLAKLGEYFDEEDQQKLYFASDNGNYLSHKGQELKVTAIDAQEFMAVTAFLAEQKGYHCAVSTCDRLYMQSGLPERIQASIRQYNPDVQVVERFDVADFSTPPIKIAVASEHSLPETKQMVQRINALFPTVRAVTSGDIWLDIYHISGGKGAALDALKVQFGILTEEVMAFGDSLNDETMLKTAKYSIAMGNSDPDILPMAAYQIGTNNEQAVLTVLEQLLEDETLAFLDAYRIER
ncbi:MAG: HAD family hydrolase [Aerococcaceae bacterium]|nr:HAD family hydrolase [Aerococcaceae bacterium]